LRETWKISADWSPASQRWIALNIRATSATARGGHFHDRLCASVEGISSPQIATNTKADARSAASCKSITITTKTARTPGLGHTLNPMPSALISMKTQLDLLERDYVTRNSPLVLAAMRGRDFTADDIHGVVEPPSNQNWYGVLFAAIRRQLVKVGYRPSERKEANGRVVAVWRVA